ncbi:MULTISPECIES: YrrS family protein [Shouchella]|uniref:DUF1510 domain-containing protein n=3 Tax=Shouchella TaxID=2893057 RepID=A0A060M0D0_9BACI|nr:MULTISPECIES: YrrS family protein [Bacillaceae]AIC93998.1 hypothetical protein BleG1_1415 [Shouchella lehensis G1]RQW19848.1 DUF1510 family protein [Bacillus sp. C1-1]TES48035.1 DUF1510 family protein [Shouchella lehensis]WDF02904.1 YrrS family protein [Shouchella hunanensis]
MGQRYESRKDKRKNQILNIAITIVVILILFFGGTLVVNMVNQDQTATEESRQIIDPDSDESDESSDNEETEDEANEEDASNEEDGIDEEEATEEDDANEEEDGGQAEVGDVLPTEQTNPAPNNFGGQNWNEMEQAAYNATGLSSSTSDTIWIGNGGSTTSAIVTLLDKGTGLYYQVRLQWVESPELGWQIESVNQSETNPN